MASTIEWAEFALKPGVNEQQMRHISAEMQSAFLDRQPGFVWRKTVCLSEGRYADLVMWQSHEAAEAAMSKAGASPACAAYFNAMDVDTAPLLGTTLDRYDANPTWAGLEFTRFRLRADADPTQLAPAAAEMVRGLYTGAPGFMHHAVLHNGQGDYVDLLLADSQMHAEALCGSWGSGSDSGAYAPACRSYLSLIEPTSVQRSFWEKLPVKNALVSPP